MNNKNEGHIDYVSKDGVYRKRIDYNKDTYDYIGRGSFNFVFLDKKNKTVIKYPTQENESKSYKDLENLKNIWNKIHGSKDADLIHIQNLQDIFSADISKGKFTHFLSVPFVEGHTYLSYMEGLNGKPFENEWNKINAKISPPKPIIEAIRKEILRIYELGYIILDGHIDNFIYQQVDGEDYIKAVCIDIDLIKPISALPNENIDIDIDQSKATFALKLIQVESGQKEAPLQTVNIDILNSYNKLPDKYERLDPDNAYRLLTSEVIESNPLLNIECKIKKYLTHRGGNYVLSDKVTFNLYFWRYGTSKKAIVKPILDEIKNVDTKNRKSLENFQETIETAIQENACLHESSIFDLRTNEASCDHMLESCNNVIKRMYGKLPE